MKPADRRDADRLYDIEIASVNTPSRFAVWHRVLRMDQDAVYIG